MIPAVSAAEKRGRDQTGAPVGLPDPLRGSRHLPSHRRHGDRHARQQRRRRRQRPPSEEVHRRALHPCPTTGCRHFEQPPGEGVDVFLHDPERGHGPPRARARLLPAPPESRGSSGSNLLHQSQAAGGGGGGGALERASGGGGEGETAGRSQRRDPRRRHYGKAALPRQAPGQQAAASPALCRALSAGGRVGASAQPESRRRTLPREQGESGGRGKRKRSVPGRGSSRRLRTEAGEEQQPEPAGHLR